MLVCCYAPLPVSPGLTSHHNPALCTIHAVTIHTVTIHTVTIQPFMQIFSWISCKNLRVMQSDIYSPTLDDNVFLSPRLKRVWFLPRCPTAMLCPTNVKCLCLLSSVFETHLHKTGGSWLAADWHRFNTCNAILQCTVCRHTVGNTSTGTELHDNV